MADLPKALHFGRFQADFKRQGQNLSLAGKAVFQKAFMQNAFMHGMLIQQKHGTVLIAQDQIGICNLAQINNASRRISGASGRNSGLLMACWRFWRPNQLGLFCGKVLRTMRGGAKIGDLFMQRWRWVAFAFKAVRARQIDNLPGVAPRWFLACDNRLFTKLPKIVRFDHLHLGII